MKTEVFHYRVVGVLHDIVLVRVCRHNDDVVIDAVLARTKSTLPA